MFGLLRSQIQVLKIAGFIVGLKVSDILVKLMCPDVFKNALREEKSDVFFLRKTVADRSGRYFNKRSIHLLHLRMGLKNGSVGSGSGIHQKWVVLQYFVIVFPLVKYFQIILSYDKRKIM